MLPLAHQRPEFLPLPFLPWPKRPSIDGSFPFVFGADHPACFYGIPMWMVYIVIPAYIYILSSRISGKRVSVLIWHIKTKSRCIYIWNETLPNQPLHGPPVAGLLPQLSPPIEWVPRLSLVKSRALALLLPPHWQCLPFPHKAEALRP